MNAPLDIATIAHSDLPEHDYVSPGLAIVMPDRAFPNMIVGDTSIPRWPYLRRWVGHNWYADRRNPYAGFVDRDEAALLYNSALLFRGKPCLEVGCWRGWSTVHLALGSGMLDVVDPILGDPDFANSVTASCEAAGVLDKVTFHPEPSPAAIHRLAQSTGKRWSLIFIDADHEGDAPRQDAEAAMPYAADTAMVLFHDLASPFVAAGLDAMRNAGWRTMLYQTMQIVGVAWRGDVQPVAHVPDPKVFWTLPRHLSGYEVSGWKPPAVPAEAATSSDPTLEDRCNGALLRAQAAEDDRVAAEVQREEAAAQAHAAQAALAARQAERDGALAERDRIRAEHAVVAAQRDQAVTERDAALTSLNLVQSQRDTTAAERDQAAVQRDLAVAMRNQALAQRDTVAEQRDDAVRQRDAAAARADATEAGIGRLGEQLVELRAILARLDETEAQGASAARQDAALRRLAGWVLQRHVLLALFGREPQRRVALLRAQAASLGFGDAVADPFVHWLGSRRTLLGLLRRSKRQGEAAIDDGFRKARSPAAPADGADATRAGAAIWLGRWFAGAAQARPAEMPRRGSALAHYFERLGFSASGAHAWVALLTTDRAPAARRSLLGAAAGEVAGNAELLALAAKVRSSANFDEAFYRDRAGLDDAEADAALHYLLVGEPQGLSPSASFDAVHYARRYDDIVEAGANSLLHYDAAGRGEGRQPLPAGAAAARGTRPVGGHAAAAAARLGQWLSTARAQAEGVRQPVLPAPLLRRYAEGLGFGATFADAWATLLAADMGGAPHRDVLDAIAAGLEDNAALAEFAARVRNSSVFDETFYRDRAALTDADTDAALHYLLLGEPLGFAPSAQFDGVYYARRYSDVVEHGVNCLLHYEATGRGEGRQALPGTDGVARHVQDGRPLPAVAVLDHWLAGGSAQIASRRQLAVSGPRLRRYFERLGFSPDGAAAWVAALTEASTPATLQDRLGAIARSAQNNTDLSTLAGRVQRSAGFDDAFYRGAAGIDAAELDAALHYLLLGEPLGIAPSPAFDPHYYACRNDDIFNAGVNGLLHYDAAGRSEGRQPLPPSYVHANPALRDPARENIIFVVHEASRTGSPILGWNILRLLAQTYNIYMIALEEGPLTPEFLALSVELYGPFSGANRHPVDMEFGLRPLFAGRIFKYAVVNSIESRRLLDVCARRFVPTVLLMHEFGSYVRPLESLQRALDLATEIVFPAPIVARSTTEAHPPLLDRQVQIHPQGMSIVPSSNTARKRPPAKQMATLLQARAKGAFIVVGAGSVIIRKGVDLFISVAADVQRLALERPVFFLWVGHGYQPEKDMGYSIYLKEQVERSGLHDRIMFMGEVSELDPIYALADAFLLTSRLDPLPNVSIDAACRGIPTICFKDASGIADLLLSDPDTAVGVVPHLDTVAAADLIGRLAADEAARGRMAAATGRLGGTLFSMPTYVAQLDELGGETAKRVARLRADAETLRADDSFDHGLFLGPDWPAIGRDEAIAQYLALAGSRRLGAPNASAAPLRRPMPGFHPWIWTAAHPPSAANAGADPLADFVRQGRPTGPWLLPVLRPTIEAPSPAAVAVRALLHAHLGDPGLVKELLAGMRANTSACDLLVTTDDEEKAARLRQDVAGYGQGATTVSVVPSRDGDGLRPIFARLADASASYDVVGHVHDRSAIGEIHRRDFDWQNMIGGQCAMRDRVLEAFSKDADLGVVFPAEPDLIGWDGSRPLVEMLLSRLGFDQPAPAALDFPPDATFWMRTALLRILLPLYTQAGSTGPDGAEPDEAALRAAFVRAIPLVSKAAGLSLAVTHVPGVTL